MVRRLFPLFVAWLAIVAGIKLQNWTLAGAGVLLLALVAFRAGLDMWSSWKALEASRCEGAGDCELRPWCVRGFGHQGTCIGSSMGGHISEY